MKPDPSIDPYLTRPDILVLKNLFQDVEQTDSISERSKAQKVDSGYTSATDEATALGPKAIRAAQSTTLISPIPARKRSLLTVHSRNLGRLSSRRRSSEDDTVMERSNA